MKQFTYLFALLLAASVIFTGCCKCCCNDDDPVDQPPVIAVTGVTLNRTTLEIEVGETAELIATVAPANATNTNVMWSSNNPAVFVNADGVITALSVGTAIIIATVDGRTAMATVTVIPPYEPVPVTDVAVEPTELELEVGETATLAVTVEPANASNQNVTWTSDDESVATVDENGVVTAVSEGTATITVTTEDGGHTATVEVTVIDPTIAVTDVTVEPVELELEVGATAPLIATIEPANATNQNVTWTSSTPAVATVNANGVVTAVSEGTATITVTTEDGEHTATVEVTVIDTTVSVTDVTLEPTALELIVGDTGTLTPTVAPANATNQNVTWASSNPAVATVDANGVVTAVSEGTVTITATTVDGGHTATAEITVTDPTVSVIDVALNPTTLELMAGNTGTLTATITPANATNQNVTWTSSNSAVATVDANGVVTAVSSGTATITVTTVDGSRTATAVVTVSLPPNQIDAGVVIAGIRWATRNVDAPGTFAQNPQSSGMFFQWNRNVGWSSTNPMVNSDGGRSWNSSTPSGTTWETQNNPCPAGWRVPTETELQSLNRAGSIWVTNWNNTGVNGRLFGTAPNQIFLPAAGWRHNSNGALHGAGADASYRSSTPSGSNNARTLYIYSGRTIMSDSNRAAGFKVRCVAIN